MQDSRLPIDPDLAWSSVVHRDLRVSAATGVDRDGHTARARLGTVLEAMPRLPRRSPVVRHEERLLALDRRDTGLRHLDVDEKGGGSGLAHRCVEISYPAE